MGSRQKKKKTHKANQKKTHHNKKKQPIKWYTKLSEKLSLHRIKAFFVDRFKRLKTYVNSLDLKTSLHTATKKMKSNFKNNRSGIIFGTSLFLIVFIGYFAIVYNPQGDKKMAENDDTISIDLNDENEITTFMDNVEDEISQIQLASETAKDEKEVVTVDLEPTEEPTIEMTEIPVADPIEVITADTITQVNTPVAAAATPSYKSVENAMMLGVETYAILVDEKPIAYFKTEGEAYMVIKDLKNLYADTTALEEEIVFKEDIKVEKVKRDIFDFGGYPSKEEVLSYIKKGTNEQRIHVVESGENFWVIAENYGLNVQDLLDANENIDEKRLQIGTELSLIVERPIINVVTISRIERIDPIPYGKDENVKTDEYFVGTYKIKRAGIEGKAQKELLVYKENGKVIGEKEESSTVLEEPVNQIAYEGTKPAPPRIGNGYLVKPTSRGYITSGFGNRSLGYHNGIDIGVPTGTDVKAADGGVVIFSGYKGTYGKLIIIDHGANIVTYYAHNSKLLVKSGESVAQGQLISLSGNTGRSTGPHLHFEVRINGSPVNPKKYVSY